MGHWSNVQRVFVFALVVGLGTACQDHGQEPIDSETSTDKSPMEANDGTLVFASVDAYDGFFEKEDRPELPEFNTLARVLDAKNKKGAVLSRLSDQGKACLEEYDGSKLLDILDEDGTVIIGENLFCLDFENRIVAVTDNFSIRDRVIRGDYDATEVKLFSFDDDVLSLLEEGAEASVNARTMLFCSDRKADGERISIVKNYNSGDGEFRFKGQLVYQKAGIYFSLMTEMKHMKKSSSGVYFSHKTNMELNCYYKIKKRCKDGELDGYREYAVETNGLTIRLYESTRGLAKTLLMTEYKFQLVDGSFSAPRFDEIRDGY
ncbi:hypothetical protein DN752_06555 [Echinicola strongylocentroti]|uniref:Uncharacterized protein n=2 Tax=Echinicola strongylocentroti TaxID=1795355 RepID=A0A2Z4IGI7_9BACT|nr:hypothetical protein DN752_06555 [Echinicola strongylocentroti]